MENNLAEILEQEKKTFDAQISALAELLEHTQRELLETQQQNLILESESNIPRSNDFIKYKEYFDNMPSGVVVLDEYGIVREFNPVAAEFFGFMPDKMYSVSFRSLLSHTSFADFSKAFSGFKADSNKNVSRFHLLQLKDRRQFSITLHKIRPHDSNKIIMVGSLTVADMALTEYSGYLAALAVDQLREGVVITDENGSILRVNSAFSEITGYSREEVLGENPRILKSGRHPHTFYANMWQQISHHGWWQGEVWNKRKSGHIYPQWLQISRIFEPATQKVFYISTLSDISERKEHQNQLDRLAHYDVLTGLMNRHFVKITLQNLLERCSNESKNMLAVMFIDLDHFKQVNDQYGHHEGDLVLQDAAHRILASVRHTDIVGRIGGDEFVVILSRLNERDEADAVAHKIIEMVSSPYHINDNSHHLSASIGVACFPDDGNSVEDLMRRADAAMYRSKHNGRAQVAFFNIKDEEDLFSHEEIKTLIRAAINDPQQHINLHYQPVFECQREELVSFEALLRIEDSNGNGFSPADVIEVAEKENLIINLGEKIFTVACEFVAANREKGVQTPPVAVNLSVQQLSSDNLFGRFNAIATAFNLDICHFNFEVTETRAMQNVETILHTIHRFKKEGCQILLDDFGTGFASLSQLHMLPVDVVKIDRSFTNMIDNPGHTHRDLIRAIASMVKILNIDLIVEGVETESQLSWIREHNIGKVQGYYFSKPLDPDTVYRSYLT